MTELNSDVQIYRFYFFKLNEKFTEKSYKAFFCKQRKFLSEHKYFQERK